MSNKIKNDFSPKAKHELSADNSEIDEQCYDEYDDISVGGLMLKTASHEELENGDYFDENRKQKLQQIEQNNQKIHATNKNNSFNDANEYCETKKLKKLPEIRITPSAQRKAYESQTKSSFVQLDELLLIDDYQEWKETGRWIKYEEVVEDGGRWGKPRVATLPFISILNLRKCLENGVFITDLEETDMSTICYQIVENISSEYQISEDEKSLIMNILLLKHKLLHEFSRGNFSFAKKKHCSYSSLQIRLQDPRSSICSTTNNISSINQSGIITTRPSQASFTFGATNRRFSTISYNDNLNENGKCPNEVNGIVKKPIDFKIDFKDAANMTSNSIEDLKKIQNDPIIKRIPPDSEAVIVLVGTVDFLKQPIASFCRLSESVVIPGVTEVLIPMKFIFFLIGPKSQTIDYREVGRCFGTLMSNEYFLEAAYDAEYRGELISAMNEFLEESIVIPPGNWNRGDLLPFEELREKKDWVKSRKTKARKEKDQPKRQPSLIDSAEEIDDSSRAEEDDEDKKKKKTGPLERTYRPWGGLKNDLRRRFPMYVSDIKDGLNVETFAATIFMYFACLSTAITFGGLVSEKTHNEIGISETLVSASLVGIIFHIFSCQPLVIIGTTGPLLLFDEALYSFCSENELSFLASRAYIGFWLIGIGVIVAAFEGSVYVRLLTRFTQEIFSALITLIYIVETFMKLIRVYQKNPLIYNYLSDNNFEEFNLNSSDLHVNDSSTIHLNSITAKPNTSLYCTILTLGTFALAYYLKLFRNSHFLGRNARRALGDFGVPIAIAIFVLIDYFTPEVYTEKLSVPDGLVPSTRKNWLVDFTSISPNQLWLPLLAFLPAILVYILIFMESHISELIVDKPERGLKKGSGLHFDIVLLCFLNAMCGILGLPWHCAATVRSVAHVASVTIMSRTHAPGETPSIIDVKEQRLSGFFVALMIGLSVNMSPLLRLIPMAVLFGVFLYMGVASMAGVQFFERFNLLFMPNKHHPPLPYVRRVPTYKMHIFTIVQALSLGVLWAVKSSKYSLAFPFFLVLMVPLRMKLSKFYTLSEMNALDGNQQKSDEDADFYEQAILS